MVLGDIARKGAKEHPQKIAFISGDTGYTFAELNERVNRLASALQSQGLGRGDKVAIWADSCSQHVEDVLKVWGKGSESKGL